MAAESTRDSPTQLLRELYFNRTGIVFLLMTLFSVLVLIASAKTHGTASQFWLAIGSATIATTGYSSVQILLTTQQFNRFLSDTIKADVKTEISKSTDRVMKALRSNNKYIPSETYDPQERPDPEFNRDLNKSLSNSARYIFRGMTARYAVVRLALLTKVPRDVRLIVADPTKPEALDYRARHEAGSGNAEAFLAAKKRILDGILMSIVGAYSIRHRIDNLVLYFTSTPNVDRIELCDSDIYVALFSDMPGYGTSFPRTARFDHESLIYRMFSIDCDNLLSSRYLTRLSISGISSEDEFIGRLRELGIITRYEQWTSAKERFEAFQSQVQRELML